MYRIVGIIVCYPSYQGGVRDFVLPNPKDSFENFGEGPSNSRGWCNWIKRLASLLGYPNDRVESIRCHGARASLTTELAEAGEGVPELMALGRWKSSESALTYVRNSRSSISNKKRKALQHLK